MKCRDFYCEFHSAMSGTSCVAGTNECIKNAYFSNGQSIAFDEQGPSSSVYALSIKQDLNGWKDSDEYVHACNMCVTDEERCVLLSSTSDPAHDADVTQVHKQNGFVIVEGIAH